MAAMAAAFAFTLSAPIGASLSGNGFGLSIGKPALAEKGGKGGGNGGGAGNSGNIPGSNSGGNTGGGSSTGGQPGGSAPDAAATTDEPEINPLLLTKKQKVTMAVFTTTIRQRYPADEVTEIENPYQAVSFYTELVAMTGHKVTHEWLYKDAVQFQASFDVGGDTWRVWSTQLLPPEMPGEWTVRLTDEDGKVLEVKTLTYKPLPDPQVAKAS